MVIDSCSKNGIIFTTIQNNKNLKVTFANLGASIFTIRLKDYVLTRNVKNIEDFKNPSTYYGKTIGRVSNRMKGNKFSLGGVIYEIEPNEGKNVLHGGPHGISNKYFEVETISYDEKVDVIYKTIVKQEEDGFPGNVSLEVRYSVYLDSDVIEIKYTAKSDADTVLSLTNHSYFTLGCRSIKGLSLSINADKYLKTTSEELLPISKENVSPALDFRAKKIIYRDIDSEELHSPRLNGYDHFFYFNNKDINICNSTLSNNKIEMQLYTDFEGMQIYTSGYETGMELYPEVNGVHDSVAIEPSDSFEKLRLLKKDVLYLRTIKYIFTYRE